MASSSSSCASNHTAYEVFLSFRGGDTRHSFTDHLFQALVRAGVYTFRDNEEIDRGQELKPDIERAIMQSRSYIVVLSENYANSRWCLDELVLILEQRRNLNYFVLPVFYHVDPSHVRNQTQSFAIKGSKWTQDNVNRWKEALTDIANLTGIVVSGSETDSIAKVVDTIKCELDLKLVSTPSHLTGIETRAEIINSWLKDEQSSYDVHAICGMGGSGKTTMAQYIYNLNKQKFESSSFVEEIGKRYQQPSGLIALQKQLLTDILGGKNVTISSVSEGTHKIEKVLQMKRVLIVLDDIDDQDELSPLLGIKTLHTQSKIIITTRLLDVKSWFGSISWRYRVHKLELLNDYESLELISSHAFGSKKPMEGFEDLALVLAKYCEGNPLALKVLGSSLYVSAEDSWSKSRMIEIWRSRMNSLSSLKGDLDCKIQRVLRKSFDSLPLSSHRELFLHIACFFVGDHIDDVVTILEDDCYAKSGIMTLINRCLLTIAPSKTFVMHQLLQDMGRNIICEESKDPAKRSRVWCSNEAYHLLREGDGSKVIEGLALKTGKLKEGTKPLALETESLVKMKNLKLLQLESVELVGSYKSFPELRWLCWHRCLLRTIPSGLLMSSLVAIDMSYGYVEKFEPPMVLNSLKCLNLKRCANLVSICSIHRLPKLETLILWNCISLTHLCETIGGLENLSRLDLTGCSKLRKALSNKKYVHQLKKLKVVLIGGRIPEEPFLFLPPSLKYLVLSYCKIDYNNDVPVAFHPQSFFHLSLSGNIFEFLPNKIDLKLLRVLNLTCCTNLKSILCIPSTLEELYTDWCTSLEKLTFESARFKLQKFVYEGCFKLSDIQGLFKLVPIAKLDESDLGNMKWIKVYKDHMADLIGDVITLGRIWKIQMLYEYGIRSIFLQHIKDQSLAKSEYTSLSPFLSFRVPLCPKKGRIRGLDVTVLYRSLGEVKDMWALFAKITNKTKSLTWIYNPVVYCKPRADEDAVWLSYWPIGYSLDSDGELELEVLVEKGLMVRECGATFVYMDGEVEQEKCEIYTQEEEVIGGDLSEFEVTKGVYYLCRRDFFKSSASYMLKSWFGDAVQSEGWRKSRQSML